MGTDLEEGSGGGDGGEDLADSRVEEDGGDEVLHPVGWAEDAGGSDGCVGYGGVEGVCGGLGGDVGFYEGEVFLGDGFHVVCWFWGVS